MMNIHLTETFLINDCDLIFAAEDGEAEKYIALHSDDVTGGCEYAVSPVSRESLDSFAKGQMGLRSLMLERGQKEWYLITLNHASGEVESRRQSKPISESDHLPKAGYHPNPAGRRVK